MPGETDRFLRNAFHQAAIAGDHPGAVIDKIITMDRVEMTFGQRHADRGGEALPQRPGGGFNPGQFEIFRVAGARAADLAEIGNVLQRRPFIACEMQQRIDQHRAMARRQHEAVAICPIGAIRHRI